MSRKAVELVLQNNPEIKTRKHRRAIWRSNRRESCCSFTQAPEGKGTHAFRSAAWRGAWVIMSGHAASLKRQRDLALAAAAASG